MQFSFSQHIKLLFALEFGALGCFFPLFSLYLKGHLQFDGHQLGWIQSCGAISAVISPLLGAIVTDRHLSSTRVLGICHACAAIMLICIAFSQHFLTVLPLYFFYHVFFGPTIGICNAITFKHLGSDAQSFSRYRVWGTLGWIASSLCSSIWLSLPFGEIHHLFLLSALLSITLAYLTLNIETPPLSIHKVSLLPKQAISAFLTWKTFRWTLFSFGITCTYQFHFMGMSPHLKKLAIPEAWIPILMCSAQIAEVFLMFKIPHLLRRWNVKKVMALGGLLSCFQFFMLLIDAHVIWMPVLMACHGMSFALLMTPIIMEMDRGIPTSDRASVHQLIALMSPGLASLIGGPMAGLMMEKSTSHPSLFWAIPSLISAAIVLGTLNIRLNDSNKREVLSPT